MSALDAIPGYTALKAQVDAARQRALQYQAQRNAASDAGNSQAYDQYQQQYEQASREADELNSQLADLIQADVNQELASPTVTTSQSQSTPPPNAQDDAPGQAPRNGGVGAGTSADSYSARGNDNTPPSSRNTSQQAINTAFGNQTITPSPNALDQYASYTYAISWWLLTPEQYNNLGSGRRRAPAPGTGNWTLLIQSGGAPTAGRSQFFPVDFYFDELEIESFLMGKGTNMSNNAMSMRFKVVEPNGLTLLQRLFDAVQFAYKNPAPPPGQSTGAGTSPTVSANQSSRQIPNYAAAQYCLTIEFYGYDSKGNLVSPIKGSAGAGAQAVIKKYYPFLLKNITFKTVANQVEYQIEAVPVPYETGTAQARGTIPFAFALAGTTVSQILQGGPLPVNAGADSNGRAPAPAPNRISNTQLDSFLNNAAELDRRQSGTVGALSAGAP